MTEKQLFAPLSRRIQTDLSITFGLTAIVLFFVASGFVSYWNIHTINQDSEQVARTHEVMTEFNSMLANMRDAETGQRGYILTGNESYLAPYNMAASHMDEQIADIELLVKDEPAQLMRLAVIKTHIHNKMTELAETITLRRAKGFDAALAVVTTDRGKAEMDMVRSQVASVQQDEQLTRNRRLEEMAGAYRSAITSGIVTSILGVILSVIVAYMVRRAATIRQRQEWLQSGQVGLSAAMLGDQRVEKLAENVLKFLSEYLGAHAGAFFIKDGDQYRRVALYGVPAGAIVPESFTQSDGLLGQAVKNARAFYVQDVPDGYLTVGSALGKGNPKHLIIAPALMDGLPNAVFELGFIHPLDAHALELLEKVSESVGIAVRSADYRAHLQNFLEETQRQAEELQAQSEELRVNNEELEEQSRALKESQVRMEQQQAELEQTNAQLEEQTQLLEGQRDDLARAKSSMQLKAQELEQASQYKSDFLANMSHELRTPLNSSLILAKLLADNPTRNLSEEQVKFAKTIQSSGNDLLLLINDILDLSKIEAGHMEVKPEPVLLESMVNSLITIFEPQAKEKGLTLFTQIDEGCPNTVESDRQRLEQILRNLLSNAIKFTEKDKVIFTVSRKKDGQIAFAISDTGIGIAADQQQAIFEAFRQADGTISRKYGGTGLGLSISRELVRLLGGTIEVKSELGKGSTFTVSLPEVYDPQHVLARQSGLPVVQKPEVPYKAPMLNGKNGSKDKANFAANLKRFVDDREKLTGERRIILVVEDDSSFAQILYDLTHELEFQCLVANTAEEALALAVQYMPSAIILDVGLPDNSGLSVLDRLKRDTRTRHIPVHVVSAGDYAQTAMSLGAVGYMVKPVKREQLIETLRKLETKLAQRLRRVLIVEDDAVQRESVGKLLGFHNVETVGVGTGAECLAKLKESTFDCMVLDLSLPDASGYSLLETLSREDSYSFPPVIVYTGRELSMDDEQKLRRYSKSIIIKGAKSPERLLDEVTLFLHQVVAELPAEQQRMLENVRNRDAVLEGRRILVVEDDVRNVYALTSILEPHGVAVQIARNGREALEMMEKALGDPAKTIDLVLMDVMMPEMDGLTATRHIRKRNEWKKLPVIMLTAKAMKDDQEKCLDAGANDYMAKPLDVEKLLSLVRVWMPR